MKIFNLKFSFGGFDHKHTLLIDDKESDIWTSFKSNEIEFDVHYDEDYMHIVVYEVINGQTMTNVTLHEHKLYQCYNCENVGTQQLYRKNSGCLSKVLNCNICAKLGDRAYNRRGLNSEGKLKIILN